MKGAIRPTVTARLVPTGFAHPRNGILLGRLSLFPLVTARLVRAAGPNAGYDTGDPDKPNHDDSGAGHDSSHAHGPLCPPPRAPATCYQQNGQSVASGSTLSTGGFG
jgi:hypothetical protein